MAETNRYIANVPLNYVHLAAYLRENGFESCILDMVFDDVTPEFVDQQIRSRNIGVVGIGCMTCELPQAVAEARRLKAAHPGIVIVFGGAHPSADPEECLQTGVVDYVIAGEGEIALVNLLAALRDGLSTANIQGVWRMEDGKAMPVLAAPVPDVTMLPRPAFDLLDLPKYFELDTPWHFPKSKNVVQFITSRGCPYQCSYCHEIHTKKFRSVPAEQVLDQIEWLVREHDVREFMVVDDIFNFDLERAKAICRGIVERGLKIHLQFPNGVRGDRFDEELVVAMKQAGTHYMSVAIETVSAKFQKLIRKNLKIDRALETIHWARKHKIEVCGFFMIGFPGETVAEVQETLTFAATAPLNAIFVSIVSPFKGTKLRTDIMDGRFGEMTQEGSDALDQLFPMIHNQALSSTVLDKMRQSAYFRFYRRPGSLLSLGRKMSNRQNVKKLARAVTRRVWGQKVVSLN